MQFGPLLRSRRKIGTARHALDAEHIIIAIRSSTALSFDRNTVFYYYFSSMLHDR